MSVRPCDFSRRHFLKASVAATAPWVVPSSVFGADPPSERMHVALIGCGNQSRVDLPSVMRFDDVQVVAVCDVNRGSHGYARPEHFLGREPARDTVNAYYAKKTGAGSYRGCDMYSDFREVLARDDVDAVLVVLPDHWHALVSVMACQAGKDVYCQKPLSLTVHDGQQMIQAVRKHRRILQTGSQYRSSGSVRRVAELVRNGRIGKVHTVTVGVPGSDVGCPPQPDMPVPPELDYERWQGPAPRAPYTEYRVHKPKAYERPGWMRHLYYCDGMITNWTTHWNDGAAFATGLERTGPVEIEASGEYPPADSFWNVLLKFEVKMRFANGVQWTYLTDKPFLKIEGTDGWVYAEYPLLKVKLDGREGYLYFSESRSKSPPELMPAPAARPDDIRFYVKSDKQDFIDCVKSRGETLEPAEVGHRVTSLGHLGHIAIQVGAKLTFDPEQERFIGNDAANALIDRPIHSPKPCLPRNHSLGELRSALKPLQPAESN